MSGLFLFFLISGCQNDNEENPPRFLEFGKTIENQVEFPVVITDSEKVLRIEEYPGDFDFEKGDRVLLHYELTGENNNERRDEQNTTADYDYSVKVLSIQEITTKQIVEIDKENRDTIGVDPLLVHDIWLGGGFLNVDFSFYGNGKVHYISIVKDPGEQPEDETEIHLQVRHDARGDELIHRYRGLMSFYLDSLQVENADSVKLVFENKEFYKTPFPGFEIVYGN